MNSSLLLRALIATGCLVAVAACGDDRHRRTQPSTPSLPTRSEVLRYETTGGCMMMGPNCATYVVYSDGTVEIYRTGENAPAEVVGSIPAAEVTAFLDSVKDTDFEALAAEVGPGTCNSCVDGIDIMAHDHVLGWVDRARQHHRQLRSRPTTSSPTSKR